MRKEAQEEEIREDTAIGDSHGTRAKDKLTDQLPECQVLDLRASKVLERISSLTEEAHLLLKELDESGRSYLMERRKNRATRLPRHRDLAPMPLPAPPHT
jgi:hypothetical protein